MTSPGSQPTAQVSNQVWNSSRSWKSSSLPCDSPGADRDSCALRPLLARVLTGYQHKAHSGPSGRVDPDCCWSSGGALWKVLRFFKPMSVNSCKNTTECARKEKRRLFRSQRLRNLKIEGKQAGHNQESRF